MSEQERRQTAAVGINTANQATPVKVQVFTTFPDPGAELRRLATIGALVERAVDRMCGDDDFVGDGLILWRQSTEWYASSEHSEGHGPGLYEALVDASDPEDLAALGIRVVDGPGR